MSQMKILMISTLYNAIHDLITWNFRYYRSSNTVRNVTTNLHRWTELSYCHLEIHTERLKPCWRLFRHRCFVQGYWQWQSLHSQKLFLKACFPVIEMCSFFSCSPASSRYFRSSTSWSYLIRSSCPSGVVWFSIKAVPCGVYTSGFLSITSFSSCSRILVKIQC